MEESRRVYGKERFYGRVMTSCREDQNRVGHIPVREDDALAALTTMAVMSSGIVATN